MEYVLVYGKSKSSVKKLSIEKVSDVTKKVVYINTSVDPAFQIERTSD